MKKTIALLQKNIALIALVALIAFGATAIQAAEIDASTSSPEVVLEGDVTGNGDFEQAAFLQVGERTDLQRVSYQVFEKLDPQIVRGELKQVRHYHDGKAQVIIRT